MTNTPDDPWSPLNEDFETPEYDDDTARPQFGKPIDPSRFPPEYVKALIEKYGHTELHSTVDDDTDDFGGLGEFGYEEGPEIVDSPDPTEAPDEELDDDAYYGTYGYPRTAPTCDDPDCHMCD